MLSPAGMSSYVQSWAERRLTCVQDLRLEQRFVDLRTPANQAIFQLQSAVCQVCLSGPLEIWCHSVQVKPGNRPRAGGREKQRTSMSLWTPCVSTHMSCQP